MAVGGVSDQNIAAYFQAGADAVAFGGSIFNLKWLDEKQPDLIQEKLTSLITNYRMSIE